MTGERWFWENLLFLSIYLSLKISSLSLYSYTLLLQAISAPQPALLISHKNSSLLWNMLLGTPWKGKPWQKCLHFYPYISCACTFQSSHFNPLSLSLILIYSTTLILPFHMSQPLTPTVSILLLHTFSVISLTLTHLLYSVQVTKSSEGAVSLTPLLRNSFLLPY